MMSISEHEQQTLDSIEKNLASSGPKLASMLFTFARLTADEEMPVRERIRRAAGVPSADPARTSAEPQVAQSGSRRSPAWLTRRTAWRLLWLVAVVAVMAIALAFDHGAGKGICTASRTAACRQVAPPASSSSPSGAG